MSEYRIDELARLAGTTVRNVRAYQDRGLLAPPRREGRVGLYSEAHLTRLRTIGQLLRRGYTFATISELIAAWERGGNLDDILGLESAVGDTWPDEPPGHLSRAELVRRLGREPSPEEVRRAAALNLFQLEGDRVRVPSPRLFQAGMELVDAGMGLSAMLDVAERLRGQVGAIADGLVRSVADHVVARHVRGGSVSAGRSPDVAFAADLVRRLLPMTHQAVDAMLAEAMAASVEKMVGQHFAEAANQLQRARV